MLGLAFEKLSRMSLDIFLAVSWSRVFMSLMVDFTWLPPIFSISWRSRILGDSFRFMIFCNSMSQALSNDMSEGATMVICSSVSSSSILRDLRS